MSFKGYKVEQPLVPLALFVRRSNEIESIDRIITPALRGITGIVF